MTLTFVDCQGFAGAFALGMTEAGFEMVGKKEMPGGFGVRSCEGNRHLLGHKWEAQSSVWHEWTPIRANVVSGNPPCSGFSLLSTKEFRGMESRINDCMHALVGYAAKVAPEVVVFESVQQAYKQGRPLMQSLRAKLEEQTGFSYNLFHVLHNNASVGGAAIRKRYFFVAARVPFGIEHPTVERVPSLHESIGDLMGLKQSWGPQPYATEPGWWSAPRRRPDNMVDGHIGRNTPMARRAFDLMAGVPWNEGDIMSTVARRYYTEKGHLPISWQNTAQKLVTNDFKMGFYQMMRWNRERPARVVTGAGVDMIMHYAEPRLFTHREVARIQGFPDTWKIEPMQDVSGLQMTWGKGIPVDCGKWIGGWIKRAIEGEPGSDNGVIIGERERVIDCTNAYKTAVPAGVRW